MLPRAQRTLLLLGLPTTILFLYFLSTTYSLHSKLVSAINHNTGDAATQTDPQPPPPPKDGPRPSRKPPINTTLHPPITDNFPLAARAHSPSDLPPIPAWNQPPNPHVPEHTPLFIGFTRNWRLLQQALVSYLTAGWPASDIYIVDNTGTMQSNALGRLTLQNPFYLDHVRLTKVYGVNVLTTPTLLTFAQLQNFFLSHALAQNWPHYFWSHQDVVALSPEDRQPFASLYARAVAVLRESTDPAWLTEAGGGKIWKGWSHRFFAFDRLALVNAAAYADVGGWDTMIPFYSTDCDMYFRLEHSGYRGADADVGRIYDLAASLEDLAVLYRGGDVVGSERFMELVRTLDRMQEDKVGDVRGRNTWQGKQAGGLGEPFYRDPEGFETAIWLTIQHGRRVFAEKWGHRDCDLFQQGLRPEDAWRVEHDW